MVSRDRKNSHCDVTNFNCMNKSHINLNTIRMLRAFELHLVTSCFGLEEEELQTADSMSFTRASHIAPSVHYRMYTVYPINCTPLALTHWALPTRAHPINRCLLRSDGHRGDCTAVIYHSCLQRQAILLFLNPQR